jgi:hypothetical protein
LSRQSDLFRHGRNSVMAAGNRRRKSKEQVLEGTLRALLILRALFEGGIRTKVCGRREGQEGMRRRDGKEQKDKGLIWSNKVLGNFFL